MRRVVLLSMLCLSVGALNGCRDETDILTENIPTAGVRFINGVPDTAGAFGMDFRWVDIVESNAHFRHVFRSGATSSGTSGAVTASTSVQFKGVRAGSRHFRVFFDDTLQSVASVVLKDSTVTLEAGKNYTAILWGYSRTGQTPSVKLSFFEETVAAPGANQTAVRVINATGNAIDVRQYETGTAVPGAPTWANVAPLSVSTHIVVDTGLIRYNIQPAGGGSPVFADAQLLAGSPAFSTAGTAGRPDIEALPGTLVPGSAVTLIVFPQSVFTSRAAKFTTTVAGNQNRLSGSIAAVAGGYRITDCACVVAPPIVPVTPGWVAGQFNPAPFGYYMVVVRPQAPSVVPPVTVLVSTNGTAFLDTAADLSAYTGIATVRYDVIGYLAGASSVWDRRPPYIP